MQVTHAHSTTARLIYKTYTYIFLYIYIYYRWFSTQGSHLVQVGKGSILGFKLVISRSQEIKLTVAPRFTLSLYCQLKEEAVMMRNREPSMTAPVSSTISVIGPNYCAPHPIQLKIEKTSRHSFTVKDIDGNTRFNLSRPNPISLHRRRVLKDAAGNPIVTLCKKVIRSYLVITISSWLV